MPMPGRHDLEVAERLLGPAQQRVALEVSLVLALDVALIGHARAEGVDLHRVVDHEVDGHERIDPPGSPPRRATASRRAARSTTAGTPVRSCMITRAGMNASRAPGPRRPARPPARARRPRTRARCRPAAAGSRAARTGCRGASAGRRRGRAGRATRRSEGVARGERIGCGHAPKPTSDPDTLGVWHHRDLACVCHLRHPAVRGVHQRRGAGAGARLHRRKTDCSCSRQTLIPPRKDNARSLFRTLFYGRYKPEHVVDVAYQVNGQRRVESGLEIARARRASSPAGP